MERQHTGRDQGAVLAQAVTHDEVGRDPVRLEQAGEGDVDRQHGRLRDLGVHQLGLSLGHRLGVVRVDEDDVAELAPIEQRPHHLVGLVEGLGRQAGRSSAGRRACWRTAIPGPCRGRQPSGAGQRPGRCRGRGAPARRRRFPIAAPSAPAPPWLRALRRRRSRSRPARRSAAPVPRAGPARGRARARRRSGSRERLGEGGLVGSAQHQGPATGDRGSRPRAVRPPGGAAAARTLTGLTRRGRRSRWRRCRSAGRAHAPRARRGNSCRRSRMR